MATKGRSYAEQLVGPLDRSSYETQREVVSKGYETNWEDLQNRYKNLQEQLKKKQDEANRNYAEGLVTTAENSFDRLNNASNNMANRGLVASGLNNLMEQADTARKGQDVLNLLDKSGDVSTKVAEQLSSGNEAAAKNMMNLADSLSNALGDIGNRETNAQMDYMSGLAGLAESMEAREDDNKLQAAQRALNNSGTSAEEDEVNAELEEAYRKQAITEILLSDDLDDSQKAMSLKILYNKGNADDIVKVFNTNKNLEDTNKAIDKEYTKQKKNVATSEELLDIYIDQILKDNIDFRKSGLTKEQLKQAIISSENLKKTPTIFSNPNVDIGEAIKEIQDYNNLNKYQKALTQDPTKNNMNKIIEQGKFDSVLTYKNLYDKLSQAEKNKINNQYENYINNKNKLNAINNKYITYEDLANLLYGD